MPFPVILAQMVFKKYLKQRRNNNDMQRRENQRFLEKVELFRFEHCVTQYMRCASQSHIAGGGFIQQLRI